MNKKTLSFVAALALILPNLASASVILDGNGTVSLLAWTNTGCAAVYAGIYDPSNPDTNGPQDASCSAFQSNPLSFSGSVNTYYTVIEIPQGDLATSCNGGNTFQNCMELGNRSRTMHFDDAGNAVFSNSEFSVIGAMSHDQIVGPLESATSGNILSIWQMVVIAISIPVSFFVLYNVMEIFKYRGKSTEQ